MARSKVPTISGASVVPVDARNWVASAVGGSASFDILFPSPSIVFLFDMDEGGWYVLPSDENTTTLEGRARCWVLPESPELAASMEDSAWFIKAGTEDASVTVRFERGTRNEALPDPLGSHCLGGVGGGDGNDDDERETKEGAPGTASVAVAVTVHSPTATLTSHLARPHADVNGGEWLLDFLGGMALSDALAGFYWGTMLPCVVERTRARNYLDSDGYVISTLADKYVGTYPDVDHEFQIKGRMAIGSALDLHVVRRMIELQLRLMREDPQQLWRDPCAVQPSGAREYHVRRGSLDGRENAVMFLISGNVEVVESVWLYISRTKDLGWLRCNMTDLEGAASCVESCMDSLGRLWSDVYYEDQVIKDGRETLAAALACRSFELLAELERLLYRFTQGEHYDSLARKLRAAIVQPLPVGYWDQTNSRFVDWVDRSGNVHDHIHLLANELPLLFNAATASQSAAVVSLLEQEDREFQRFPSFLAARIRDYTRSEIGDGGPYDLCAAGRYWCWDAAFWSSRSRGDVLRRQLEQVARMGARDGYVMGERYDMNHVYYKDGPPWHGAAHYYEYPCVFAWVLVNEYLGVRACLDANVHVRVAPCLDAAAGVMAVTLRQGAYQLQYRYRPGVDFMLRNLGRTTRSFQVDLSALFPTAGRLLIQHGGPEGAESTFEGALVRLRPGAGCTIRPA